VDDDYSSNRRQRPLLLRRIWRTLMYQLNKSSPYCWTTNQFHRRISPGKAHIGWKNRGSADGPK
jgi:hypothetical protein